MSCQSYAVRYRNFHGSMSVRHIEANNPEQAAKKVRSKGRFVTGVKKVRAEDIIGLVATKQLIADVVGKLPPKNAGILDTDTTLDSIVFSQKFQVQDRKVEHIEEEPLWYKKNKREIKPEEFKKESV